MTSCDQGPETPLRRSIGAWPDWMGDDEDTLSPRKERDHRLWFEIDYEGRRFFHNIRTGEGRWDSLCDEDVLEDLQGNFPANGDESAEDGEWNDQVAEVAVLAIQNGVFQPAGIEHRLIDTLEGPTKKATSPQKSISKKRHHNKRRHHLAARDEKVFRRAKAVYILVYFNLNLRFYSCERAF